MSCGEYNQIFGKKIRTLNWLRGEKINRVLFIKSYTKQSIFNTLIHSDSVTFLTKNRIFFLLNKCSSFSYASRHVHRCLNSGRTRFVLRRYGLARPAFRQYLRLGKITNNIKASW